MHIIIIGNGIAGTNAARYIRKLSDHQVTMISEETLQPFSRTALMYVYMGHMKQENTQLYEDWFWDKNRINRVFGRVAEVLPEDYKVVMQNGDALTYDKLIIATGSKPNKFGWPGQDLKGVQGLYHLQDLESMEANTPGLKKAVIVGGGLIGIEMAEMFHSRHIPVTFLVRENSFWDIVLPKEESAMINRHIKEHGIDLRLATELQEVIDDGKGRAGAIITKSGERIDCQFVGLTVGVSPNIDFLRKTSLQLNRGVLVNDFLQTSHPDVFAIGDCAELRTPQPGRRPIEAIWYTGRMMGQTVAHTICKAETAYKPRLWFNSAKFLDIEYQVYGDIPAQVPAGVETLYWEHSQGRKSVRINYDAVTGAVKGFNLMGIRYRHEVCEKWILDQTPIDSVLQDLTLANFDLEFFEMHEAELVKQYVQKTGKEVKIKSSRSLNAVTRFLNKIKA